MRTHTRACVFACARVCVCVCVRVRVSVRVSTCVHTHVHVGEAGLCAQGVIETVFERKE